MNHTMGSPRRRALVLLAALLLALSVLTACAKKAAQSTAKADEIDGQPWDTSVPVELTDEVRELLTKAAKGTSDKEYIPVAVLGTRAGTYCVLCREISASGAPKNVLVYVNGDGIQNTYELWIEKHDTKGS